MAIESTRDLCLSVADAIREKKGTSELVNPQDFAKEIASIEGGGSGGGGELEGEYFLAKPNGRYWKFTFSPDNHYIDTKRLSAEQLEALRFFCEFAMSVGVVCGAGVCTTGIVQSSPLRVDGVAAAAARLGAMYWLLVGSDDLEGFNENFLSVWKECSVKTSIVTETVPFQEYDLVSYIKMVAGEVEGQEVTDEMVLMTLSKLYMLIPATEEEYKAARLEN